MSSTTTDQITGFSGSLAVKQPVRLATTAPIVLEGLFAIDGVVPAEGDRILVKDQADASQNGIYIASSGVWSRDFNAWLWTHTSLPPGLDVHAQWLGRDSGFAPPQHWSLSNALKFTLLP